MGVAVGWLVFLTARADDAVGFEPLTGRVWFGDVEARYSRVENDPWAGAVPDPVAGGWRTELVLAEGVGEILGHPALRLGGAGLLVLPVRVREDGDAEYLGPEPVEVEGSRNGQGIVSNVRFGYARLRLGRAGFGAFDAYVRLPAGHGLGYDPESRVLTGRVPLGEVPLDAGLRPRSLAFEVKASDLRIPVLRFHSELMPLILATDRVTWRVDEGAFEIADGRWENTREREQEFLESPHRRTVIPEHARNRESNDGMLRSARGLDGVPLRLWVGPDGLGRWNASVVLAEGRFRPHFPAGPEVEVQSGRLVWREGEIDREISHLLQPPGSRIPVAYGPGCPDGDCGDGKVSGLEFSPDAGRLGFTRDGGVTAEGEVEEVGEMGGGVRLAWGPIGGGRFAHSAGGFTRGSLLTSGFVLRNEGVAAGAGDSPDLPGVLLLSGHGGPGNPDRSERPRDPAYAEGASDYPGLNFRVTREGSVDGVSWIGGRRLPVQGSYPLEARSKYYVRGSGVTGRHLAVTAGFPGDFRLGGFPSVLSSLRLSFLGNRVERSATDGRVLVPYPSDFEQPFSGLLLRCNGQPREARVAGDPRHLLAYWLAPIQAHLLEFRSGLSAPCDTPESVLVLGASVRLPLVRQAVPGVLGFRSDGNLVTSADQIEGVDSRLELPSRLEIEAPEGRSYRFQPVARGYFNRWPGPGGEPVDGFVNLAGKLDLPWFLDAKVHLHALGAGARPLLHLMGGWTSAGGPEDPGRAWLDPGGHSFFDRQDFDAVGRGYPEGIPLTVYRDSGDERYRVRAQQRFMGLPAGLLDFPVAWEAGTRSFASAGHRRQDLFVFELQGEARRITAASAHLEYGVSVAERVPSFSASEFLVGQIEGRTGLFSSVSNAVSRVLTNNAVAGRLRRGAEALDLLLTPDLGRLLGEDLAGALTSPVDAFLDDLLERAAAGGVAATNLQAALCARVAEAGNPIRDFERSFVEGSALLETLGDRVSGVLAQAEDGVSSAIEIISLKPIEPVGYERRVVGEIVKRLVREAPPDAPPLVLALARGVGADILDRLIDQYLSESLEPSLAELERTLRQVDGELLRLKGELESGRGDLRAGFERAQEALVFAGKFHADLTAALCADLVAVNVPLDLALQDRVRLRERIKRVILAEWLKGVFPKEVHGVLKQYLLLQRGLFRAALDDLFDRLNEALVGVALGPARDLLRDQAGVLDSGVLQALDRLRNVLSGTRLRGTADILGDDLRRLRVDGEFRFALGAAEMGQDAKLSMEAWYQIDRFRGDAPGRGCLPAGGTFQELSFGAATTPRDGFAAGVRVGVSGRFGVRPGGLEGLSGALTLTGQKKVGGFTVKDPQLAFSFGEEGAYLGGAVAGRFKNFSMTGRMFMGSACRLGELELVDPQTAEVMKGYGITAADRWTGFYQSGDLILPLEKLLPTPLPSTCLLHVEARGGTGYFGFAGRRPGEAPGFFVGLRQKYGLKGELLCLLTGGGELELVGAVGADLLGTPAATVVGELRLSGQVGVCPLCETLTKKYPWKARLEPEDVTFLNPF